MICQIDPDTCEFTSDTSHFCGLPATHRVTTWNADSLVPTAYICGLCVQFITVRADEELVALIAERSN